MNGLGRLLALGALSGDEARRHADDEWRALHRRPDVPPLPDDEAPVVADRRLRGNETFRLRHLVARFARR
jgi:hypothetical protein